MIMLTYCIRTKQIFAIYIYIYIYIGFSVKINTGVAYKDIVDDV